MKVARYNERGPSDDDNFNISCFGCLEQPSV